LKKLEKCVRNGFKPYLRQELGQTRVSHGRTLVVIAWWVKYAEETAERLPDSNKLMTPCRQLMLFEHAFEHHSFGADRLAAIRYCRRSPVM